MPSQMPPATPPDRKAFLALFASIMLPMFLALVDQTIVAAALPAIAADLGNVERVSWIVISYLVATTIAAPVYGRLGDAFGRRRLMFVALAVMIVATVICGFAQSVEMLTAARILQGLGGGGLLTLSQALIGETVPPRDRPRYQGLLATTAVTASAFGAVIGGFLTEHFGWRSVFFVGVPVAFVALEMARRLPVRERSPEPFRFDTLGVILFSVFITSALVALYALQQFRSQDLPVLLGLLAVALITVVFLFRWERRAPDPLLSIPLMRNPAIWRASALAGCHGAVFVALLTFLPIYLRVVHGVAAGGIGVLLLPVATTVAIGSTITGWLITRTGRTAFYPSVGLPLVVVLLVGIALFAGHLDLVQLAVVLALTALFMGTTMGVVQLTVQSAAGIAMLGAAAAMVQFSRSLGAALGAAIVGTVLFASIAISDPETATTFARIVQLGPDVIATLPEARQATIVAEIADAFRAAFFTMAAIAAISSLLAWSLPLRRI